MTIPPFFEVHDSGDLTEAQRAEILYAGGRIVGSDLNDPVIIDNLTKAQRQRVNTNAEVRRNAMSADEPSFGEDDQPIDLEPVSDPPPTIDVGTGVPMMPAFKDNARGRVLALAERLVNRDRNASYGDPNQDFGRTSGYWNIHLFGVIGRKMMEAGLDTRELSPALESILREITDTWDVAIMVGQVKDSRLAWSPNSLDNWADKGGYSACGVDCAVAAGLIDIDAMDPVGGRVVDPPQTEPEPIPLHIPMNFDPANQFHIMQLLQQTPPSDALLAEPRPDQVAKMTVGEYAEATGRLPHLHSFMSELWPELDDDAEIPYKHVNIGDAMKAVVMMPRS